MRNKRKEKILELVSQNAVQTQEELASMLKSSGFDVTQATVSRDIKDLGLVKIQTSSGIVKYTKNNFMGDIYNGEGRSDRTFRDAVIKIDSAGNLIVIKCFAGMAPAAGAVLDSMDKEEIIGTIAGDDTIFVACRNDQDAVKICGLLENYIRKNK